MAQLTKQNMDLTTREGIRAASVANLISIDEALDALEVIKDAEKSVGERIIKRTEKGGLYVKDASFLATSKTGNEYVAGLNVQWEVAQALFSNPALLNAIASYVASNPPIPVPTAEELAARAAKAKKQEEREAAIVAKHEAKKQAEREAKAAQEAQKQAIAEAAKRKQLEDALAA